MLGSSRGPAPPPKALPPGAIESQAQRILHTDEFLGLDFPARELVVDPILPKRGLALLHGPRGLGKSQLALQLACAAACGGPALGRWSAPAPRRVLYIDGLLPAPMLQDRLAAFDGGKRPPGH